MKLRQLAPCLGLMLIVGLACAPAAPTATSNTGTSGSAPTTLSNKTMTIAIRAEPDSLNPKRGVAGGITLTTTKRLF